MKAIDQVLVEGQGEQFALLAPEVINDYVETIGKPCQNPLGYTAGSLILAKDLEGVQRMFKVTANISSSQNVVEGTNVERKKLEDLFDGINSELGSVKQALSDEVETRAKLGAHNLWDIDGWLSSIGFGYTKSGATYSFPTMTSLFWNNPYVFSDSDREITISATIVNGTAVGTKFQILNSSNQVVATIDADTASATGIGCKVRGDYTTTGTATVTNPMITLADDPYTGYLPYVPTNAELLSADANAELGAHNLLPLTIANLKSFNTQESWVDNAYTHNGITFTVERNADGAITDVKVSGTNAASNNDLILYQGDLSRFAGMFLSGRPAGVDGVSIRAELIGSPYTNYGSDMGKGVIIANGIGANCKVFIRIDPNKVLSDVKFYPMISLASDPSTKFTPYAMTNRELTDAAYKKTRIQLTGVVTGYATLVKTNGICVLHIENLSTVSNVIAETPYEIGTIPEGFRPISSTRYTPTVTKGYSNKTVNYPLQLILETTGAIKIFSGVAVSEECGIYANLTYVTT